MNLRHTILISLGFCLILHGACIKGPNSRNYRSQIGNSGTENGINGGAGNTIAGGPLPVGLVIDNSKLNLVGSRLKAKINLNGQLLSQEFTPSGSHTVLKISSLAGVSNGLISLEIYQGETLKFTAKKSKVAFLKPASSSIVIDDCLILPAPWDGKGNDGSCEWTITEPAN